MTDQQQEINSQANQGSQVAASDEQTKLIETLKQQKDIFGLRVDLAESAKKLNDLQNPAPKSELDKLKELKDLLAVSAAGSIPGDVKLDGAAGSMEIELLSSTTVSDVAQRVAQRVDHFCAGKNITIYLYTGEEGQQGMSLRALSVYRSQQQLVRLGYKAALDNSSYTLKNSRPSEPPTGGGDAQDFPLPVPAVVAASTLVLDSAAKLLSFFRSDYTVTGSTLSTPDSILATEVANFLIVSGHSVLMPQIYNRPSLAAGVQGVFEDCQFLDRQRVEAIRNIAEHKKQVDAVGTDGALKDDHQAAADRLHSAISLHESLEKELFTTDGQGDINLEKVAMDIAVERAISSINGGAYMLLLKDTKAGGTSYTEKNLWTGFGGIPFHLGAGIVTSFLLFNGKSGQVEASGVETSHSGYVSVRDVGRRNHRH
jgi:hypothetical protein